MDFFGPIPTKDSKPSRQPGPARVWYSFLLSVFHLVPTIDFEPLKGLIKRVFDGIMTPTLENAKDDSLSLENTEKNNIAKQCLSYVYCIEWGLALVQAYIDYKVISASFLLKDSEKKLITLSDSLYGSVDVNQASIISTEYFLTRNSHRNIISLNRSFIFISLACDVTQIFIILVKLILSNEDPQKLLRKVLRPWTWSGSDIRFFLKRSWVRLLSLPLNSLWYNIFVNTPSFKPRGITKITMDVLNAM